MVAYYQQVGFIPAGVLNAVVRIGWSYDDQTEILSLHHDHEVFAGASDSAVLRGWTRTS
jgi:glutamyl-tRNA synthetase